MAAGLPPAQYRGRYEGDSFKTNNHGDERYISPDGEIVSIKRLTAVAWFGFDEIPGKKVFHKTVPWDIREGNLIVAANYPSFKNQLTDDS